MWPWIWFGLLSFNLIGGIQIMVDLWGCDWKLFTISAVLNLWTSYNILVVLDKIDTQYRKRLKEEGF